MADCRITHIRKPNRFSTHEHITHVGNINNGVLNWEWKREEVINSINLKTNTFYVETNGNRSNVGVVVPNDSRAPFLRTYADGVWNDNLLSLPELP
ncbi:MAG: DUF3892 domain-containing protein [Bacteroidetes bacterium]|nr:DUF3892 domain-containing protein [Bacteroidota bacterium]